MKPRRGAGSKAGIRPSSGGEEAISAILALLQNGRPADAERACEALLARAPTTAAAHYLLGTLALQRGDAERAIQALRSAASLEPANASYLFGLASALCARGRAEEAVPLLQRAAALKPDLYDAHSTLAAALNAQGRSAEAVVAANRAVALRPDLPQALQALGTAQIALGQLDSGIASLERALERQPQNPQALHNLGVALKRQKRYDEAAEVLRRAVAQSPGYVNALTTLATTLREMGCRDEALATFDRVVAMQPESVAAHWSRCMAVLPVMYSAESDIVRVRAEYESRLHELVARFDHWSAAQIARAAPVVGASTPFYLAYQGFSDRDLQALYGTLACRVMAARYPEWARSIPAPALGPGERIRVGFVSGFFSPNHSNWKIPMKGWLEQLDRSRFDLYGYHTRESRNEVTERLGASLTRFDVGPRLTEDWCTRIRADRLHVLIFPETGMDSMTTQLAAMRLAPVQCTSWGHPVTSGLPTVDYFLSAEAMEPGDADAQYTERLVRLPGLSIYYDPPTRLPLKRGRADLGVREDAVLYWCCQALYKYLPQFDGVFASIASAVPSAQFVFLAGETDGITQVFRDRFENSLKQRGLDPAGRYAILARRSADEYAATIEVMDVFLDSIGWSGCNSTLEALAAGIPAVTLEGATMRARHTAAILRRMGLEDSITHGVEEYVGRAVRLGLDAEERRRSSERVRELLCKVHRDSAAIAGLEAFLQQAAMTPSRLNTTR